MLQNKILKNYLIAENEVIVIIKFAHNKIHIQTEPENFKFLVESCMDLFFRVLHFLVPSGKDCPSE